MAVEDTPVLSGRKRITLLNVPLDRIPSEEMREIVCRDFLNIPDREREGYNIVLLSLWDLLRARRKNSYRDYVLAASLVIPISKSLVGGAAFLARESVCRYMPFHFIVDLLTILENREYTIYLLGGKDKVLKRVENNIHQTFPGLRIVGRCGSSFRRQEESAIVEAIRKAAPHLLLVGRGVAGGELWISRNHDKLNKGLRIWCSDLFDVFAEKKFRPSDWMFNHGLEAALYCLFNPLKLFRIFSYIRYKFLLLFYKIFNKR